MWTMKQTNAYLKPRHRPLNVLCSSGMSRNGNQTRPTELRENQQLETRMTIYTREHKRYKIDQSNELNQILIQINQIPRKLYL